MKRRLRGYLMTAFSVGASCLMLIGMEPAIKDYIEAVGLTRVYADDTDNLVDDLSKTILARFRASQREYYTNVIRGKAERASRSYRSSVSGNYDDSEPALSAGSEAEQTVGTDFENAEADSVEAVGEWVYYGNCRITHYDAGPCCCGEWATGCTASGVLATTHHTVATGDDLPFGTELLINGEVYVVEDRGVDPYCVDIFVEDHLQALELGMYYTDVYIKN